MKKKNLSALIATAIMLGGAAVDLSGTPYKIVTNGERYIAAYAKEINASTPTKIKEKFRTIQSAKELNYTSVASYTLTPNDFHLAGAAVYRDALSIDDSFRITGSVNIGDKNEDHGGGDGVAFAFARDDLFRKSDAELKSTKLESDNGFGLEGLDEFVGFKVDTWRNREDTKIGNRSTYATIVQSDNGTVKDFSNGTTAVPDAVRDPSQNENRNFIFDYVVSKDSTGKITSRVLTVTYDDGPIGGGRQRTQWSINAEDIPGFFENSEPVYFMITGVTGGSRNYQSVILNSLDYTEGYDKLAHQPTLNNNLVENTKTLSGTGVAGDKIVIYGPEDEAGNKELLGTTTVKEDGTYSFGGEGEAQLSRPLVKDEVITAVAQSEPDPDTGEIEDSNPATQTVGAYDATKHVATITAPKESDTSISGTGTPGDTISVKDSNNKVIGTTTVKEDGTYTIDKLSRPLVAGETLTATPLTGTNEGTPVDTTVTYDKSVHDANVKNASEGTKTVTGTGTPGDTITIMDADKNVLGSAVVAEDGSYTVTTDRELKVDEVLTATPTTTYTPAGGTETTETGTPGTGTVSYDKTKHPVTLDTLKEGEKVISGTGTPGDVITVTNGTVSQTATVKEDGTFSVPLTDAVKQDEKWTATPTTNNTHVGDPVDTTAVYDSGQHMITINKPDEGTKQITGTGTPGDEIEIKDQANNVIGSTTVGENGQYTITTDRELTAQDILTATATTTSASGTNTSVASKTPVNYVESLHDVTVNPLTEGTSTVTGQGKKGDKIEVRDANGTLLGSKVVGEDGSYTVTTDRVLKADEVVKVTPITDVPKADLSGMATQSGKTAEQTVTYDATKHEVMPTKPKDTDEVLTGKGTPGDKVVVTDKDGNKVAEGTVDPDGNFSIKPTTPLTPGEELTYTPTTGDNTGTPVTETVDYDKDGHKVTPTTPKDTDDALTGTGIPGDKVVVTDKDGNKVGEDTVDKDGNFSIKPTTPLTPGEELTYTPTTGDNTGTPVTETVDYDKDGHQVKPTTPKDTDDALTGTGTPGDKVVVTDKDGNKVGEGTVDKDGNFSIKPTTPLTPGEELTYTPSTGDNEGTPTTETVDYDKAGHTVTPTAPKDTDTALTGTGTPGDKVVVTDKDGNKVGEGTVDEDGNFSIKPTTPLTPGEELTYTPSTGDNTGTPATATVTYEKSEHVVKPTTPKDTDDTLTGTGTPGDTVVVTDKDGNKVGEGTVDKDGNFSIKPTTPLTPGEELTYTPSTGDNEGTPTTETVDYDKDGHKVTPTTPKDTDDALTGTGTPGDKVVVTDKDGNKVGEGTVDSDGKFSIKPTTPLTPGEELTYTPSTGGNEGTPTTETVNYDKDGHKVTANVPKEAAQEVTGKGIAGDTVVVTDKDGNKLGEGIVDKDGNFTIPTNRPLISGETLTLTPGTGDNTGTPATATVTYEKSEHVVKPTTPKDTDDTLTGTGTPGDTVVVTDKDGNKVGEGTVDKDGNFSIKPTTPLTPGEELTYTPSTGDNEGTPTKETVDYDKDGHKVTPTTPTEGDKTITGTGTPGDKVVVTDKDGNTLGEGTVDKDGNFTIPTNRPVDAGEELTLTPSTGDNTGTPAKTTPTATTPSYNPEDHKVTATTPTEGDKTITGTGTPGDKVVVTDKDGNTLGEGTVDKEGNFTVDLDRPVDAGEELTLTPNTGDNKGPATTVTPDKKADETPTYNPADHIVTATKPVEGDTTITGKGTPGDTVTVTDKDGNPLGSGVVDANGDVTIPVSRPLVKDEVVNLTPSTGDNTGTPTKEIVSGKTTTPTEAHKVAVVKPTEGDTSVSGTGVAGDTVTVKDANGTVLGTGVVDANGNYTIPTNRPLVKDEVLTVTPMTGDKAGIATQEIVDAKTAEPTEAHKVAVVKPIEGDTSVSGTGVAGDTVTVKDANGTVLGTGVVDANGNYTIPVSRPLAKDEAIVVTPMTGDQAGVVTNEIVGAKPVADQHAVTLTKPTEGDTSVSGTGVAGDTVTLTDANGTVLGTSVIDANGKYSIPTSRPLVKNEAVMVTPTTDGKAGVPAKDFVDEKAGVIEAHAATLDKPVEGDTDVSGTGVAGDTITITDAKGTILGTGVVDANGEYEFLINRPLVKGEIITATPSTGNQAGTPTKEVVNESSSPVDVGNQITVNKPTEGTSVVTGTGIPGDTVVITDAKGTQLGSAVVDQSGNYSVTTNRPLVANEVITATAVTNGIAGESVDEIVQEKPYNTNDHKVTAETPKAGDKTVTGKGTPGDTVVVTDKDGKEIGKGTVDKDGNFTVNLDRPVKGGEKLNLTPMTGDNKGPVTSVTAEKTTPEYNANDHKVTVETPKADDKTVTGKGTPGDTVVVTDKDGKEIGKGTVDKDGNFTVELDRPVESGEELNLTPMTGDNKGPVTSVTADKATPTYNANDHKVTAETPKADDQTVTGKGTPGDTIVVTDKDGKEIGKGTVDKDGNFTVNLDRPVKGGEELNLTPMTGDNKGPVTSVTVDKAEGTITVVPPKAGDTSVTGTGEVGDKVTVKDGAGDTLGTSTVGQDGNYTVSLKRPLVVGETIKVVSDKSGEKEVMVGAKETGSLTGLPTLNSGSSTGGFSSGTSTGYTPNTSYSKSLPSTNEKISIGATITGALAIMASFALAVFSRKKDKE